MMTYLKHVGNFKHSELKTKKFEEIQALYEKIKRSDEDFISIGSAEDERLIKRMNEKGIDSSKNEMVKEESKEEVKEESKKEEESNRTEKTWGYISVMTEAGGLVIHLLVENKSLVLAELEPEDFDGDEEDL
ncbi:hypothetical protein Tco_0405819 [Tanacetum coccineum]